MQLVSAPGAPTVVVDFAHTPDAVGAVLDALQASTEGQLYCVVGCGGDRDKSKRSLMGKTAVDRANRCWFTSDNPRTENPAVIVEAMLADVNDAAVVIELDRKAAIDAAIDAAGVNDVVVILGKGHESHQEMNGKRLPHDDVAYASCALALSANKGVEA